MPFIQIIALFQRNQSRMQSITIPLATSNPTSPSPTDADTPLPSIRMVLVVAVALFDGQGRVLLAQRPPGKAMAGLWEFPGGKVEVGETPEAALVRELEEELGIEVDVEALEPLTFASHTYLEQNFHLLMPLYGKKGGKWAALVIFVGYQY